MKLSTILFLLLLSVASIGQNIISVNGNHENGSSDYTTIQAAIDAANPGDIIQIYPGEYAQDLTIDKPLYIQGVGYLLTHNYPNHDWSSPHSYINTTVYLTAGAENSILEGLNIRTLEINGVDDIQVLKSRIQRGYFQDCFNTKFESCYLGGWYYGEYDSQYLLNQEVEISFENCLIPDSYNSSARDYIFRPLNGTYGGSLSFKNCVFRNYLCSVGTYVITVTNSIGLTGQGRLNYSAGLGSYVSNSIFQSVACSYASAATNIFNITPTNEFIGYGATGSNGYSFDKQYDLKSTSQAIGYATDGGDCGIFGGNKPYVLSGVPSFPFIYGFEADQHGSTGGGIDVNIKVKSQN